MRGVIFRKPEVVPRYEGDENEEFRKQFMARSLFRVMTAVVGEPGGLRIEAAQCRVAVQQRIV